MLSQLESLGYVECRLQYEPYSRRRVGDTFFYLLLCNQYVSPYHITVLYDLPPWSVTLLPTSTN
jgi:hypothetical protein